MVGVMSNSSALSREFVKIEIGGKVIKGNSKVENSGDYFDGHCPQAFHAFSGIDGTVFDLINLKLRVTKHIQDLWRTFLREVKKKLK